MSQRRSRMGLRIAAGVVRGLLILGLGFVFPTSTCADTGITLLGWDQVASHIPTGGPSRDLFELAARVRWPQGLSGPHGLQIVLPSGQVQVQNFTVKPGQTPRSIPFYLPGAAVRNLRPSQLAVRVTVTGPGGAPVLSNTLVARIENFPHPSPAPTRFDEQHRYGWGSSRKNEGGAARLLDRAGPLGLRFAWIPANGAESGFYLATTELSNAQAARLLKGYNPRNGRSDEFLLEAAQQPAIGLTPNQTREMLSQLSKLDRSGIAYRLPSTEEWLRAARAGRDTKFWWGDAPSQPTAVNWLGPEPPLAEDATASTQPATSEPRYAANPWGLFHMFGNVAEWCADGAERFERLGGHFRTDPEEAAEPIRVEDANSTGLDPYVGLRPAFGLDAESGARLIQKALANDQPLARLQVRFTPDEARATLTGSLPDAGLKLVADQKIAPIWFVSVLENQVEVPKIAPGHLARLGAIKGSVRTVTPMGHWYYEVPLEVRWGNPLPVQGSDWWVNIFLPGGGHQSHRLISVEPDRTGIIKVMVEHASIPNVQGIVGVGARVGLSLGGQASTPSDANLVSNVVPIQWRSK